MKKEYHFAAVNWDESESAVECPCCGARLIDDEVMVRIPRNGTLAWICAACAVKTAVGDGMPDVTFNRLFMACHGGNRCASFECESVGIISEVCRY